jgi:hypothetical protein
MQLSHFSHFVCLSVSQVSNEHVSIHSRISAISSHDFGDATAWHSKTIHFWLTKDKTLHFGARRVSTSQELRLEDSLNFTQRIQRSSKAVHIVAPSLHISTRNSPHSSSANYLRVFCTTFMCAIPVSLNLPTQ